jgi:1,4-alpha-glucan branching enzyme
LAAYENWNADDTFNSDLKDAEQQKQIQECVKKLNEMYISEPALYELDQDSDGFEWINNISANESILTFVRKGVKEEDLLLVVCNFEDIDHTDYKIGVPLRGKYKEIFNSANASFGGNGFVNARLKQSKTDECDGREESVRVNVAGLSVAVFKYSKAEEKVAGNEAAKENVAKKTSKAAETKKETAPAKPKKTTAKKAAETVTKTATTAKKKVTETAADAKKKVTETAADAKKKVTETAADAKKKVTETAADAKKKVTETATDAKKKVSETVADVKKKATDTKKKETETASDEKKKATKSTKKAADKTTTKSE